MRNGDVLRAAGVEVYRATEAMFENKRNRDLDHFFPKALNLSFVPGQRSSFVTRLSFYRELWPCDPYSKAESRILFGNPSFDEKKRIISLSSHRETCFSFTVAAKV